MCGNIVLHWLFIFGIIIIIIIIIITNNGDWCARKCSVSYDVLVVMLL
jgi:hypothetical protein